MKTFTCLAWLIGLISASTVIHDAEFTPDHVLVATLEAQNVNCEVRSSVLINGTSPGPTIDLRENHTTWIRVWNRMPDDNLTMVCITI